jgi:hypothetical protein
MRPPTPMFPCPDYGLNIFTIFFCSIPQVLNKKLSKAWHSASKDSGHAGTRDIVSIQELYPFLLKVFGLSTYMCYVISQVVYMLLKQTLKMPNIQSLIYSPVVALLDQCFQN